MKRISILLATILGIFLFTQSNQRATISTEDLISRIKERVLLFNKLWPSEKIYVQTDRPFYQPGDDIWFSLYLVDGETNKPSGTSGLAYVDLINPKGALEKRLHLVIKEGKATGDFKLSDAATGGMYTIKSYTNWMKNFGTESYFEKEIQVQSSMLPDLLLKLDYEKEAYGPGDEVIVEIEVKALNGKPICNNKLDFQSQVEGKNHVKGKANTDSKGKALIKFSLPKKLSTPDGLLNVQVTHEGVSESISRSIPIVLNEIDLQFFPEGGDMVVGAKNRIAFKALNIYGKPADVKGQVLGDDGKVVADFSSYHQGMGAFEFVPENGTKYEVKITHPAGISTTFRLPEVLSSGYLMRVNHKGEAIEINIQAPTDNESVIVSQMNGNILYSESFKFKKGSNSLSVSTIDFPTGIVQFTLFDATGDPKCERLVFNKSVHQPNVQITTNKEAYQPREQVDMTIKVTDDQGMPVSAQFSLAVVDDKLLSFADDKQDNILSYLLLSSVVKGDVYEPSFYFDEKEEKSGQALDYLLMTQGWRMFAWKEVLQNTHAFKIPTIEYQPEKTILKGRLIRYKDESPATGVKVTVLETEEYTYTDQKGRFSFENLDLSTPVTLYIKNNEFERIISVNDYAQDWIIGHEITGAVLDDLGEGIPGVNVIIKGTATGAVTDIEGNYRIKLTEIAKTIQFYYIGYKTEEVEIHRQQEINVTLVPDIVQLDEMVVVAFGVERRGAFAPVRNRAKVKKEKKYVAPVEINILELADEAEIDLDIEFAEDMVLMEVEDMDFPEEAADDIFTIVEDMPRFKGGMESFYAYMSSHLNYPPEARRGAIEGKVFVQFVIDEEGNLDDVTVVKGIGHQCDEAAIQAIKHSPKWKPGKQRGRPVKTRMIIPINFSLTEMVKIKDGLMFQIANHSDFNVKSAVSKYYKGREFYMPKYTSGDHQKERTDFRKTIYWNPDIRTNDKGEATFSFYTSDEITNFRAIAEGISSQGEMLRKEHTFNTELPFNLTVKFPEMLTYEDTLHLQVILKNNTSEAINGKMKLNLPDHLTLIDNYTGNISIQANSYSQNFISLAVKSIPGKAGIGIAFKSKYHHDVLQDTIIIEPKGFPMTASFSNNTLNARYSFNIDHLVPNSLKAQVTAYPDIISDLMQGVESILREPYGCFEQASSTTYPNLIALQYLRETGEDNFEVRKKALDLIHKGYNKLVAYETKEDGYEWFGHSPPHEALTAYGLMEFTDMQDVYASVNPKMISRTSNWLMSRRDGVGGFLQSAQGLDQFGRADKNVSDLYIIYALSESEPEILDIEWEKSFDIAMETNDAYLMGLAANTLLNSDHIDRANELIKKTQKMIEAHGFGKLPAKHSVTRSTGKSLQIESASLISMALLKQPQKDLELIEGAIDYLIKSRNAYGGFGSTQATILALKAMTSYAAFAKRTKDSGILEVKINDAERASRRYEKDTKGEVNIQGLEKFIGAGQSEIEVQFAKTKEPLPYTLGIEWTTYTPPESKECKVKLSTQINKSTIDHGATVRLEAQLTNLTSEGLPMTMALIGIPSGLSVQPWQLKELQEKKVYDFYEIKDNYLIIYYRDMAPNETCTINLDLKSEIPGIFQAPASCAYLYYTNEYKDWIHGERIEILK